MATETYRVTDIEPTWLPNLLLLEDYKGNWERYIEAVYMVFRKDFLFSRPSFRGDAVAIKRYPDIQGKEATFWHLVSEGKSEIDRFPDLRRCERIKWPRAFIENCTCETIKMWENKRRTKRRIENRVLLWSQKAQFLVVLTVRSGYYILCSAYPVLRAHTINKLEKEYEAYIKASGA